MRRCPSDGHAVQLPLQSLLVGLAVWATACELQLGVGAPEGEAASALVVDKARHIVRRLPEDIRLSSPKEPPKNLSHTRQSYPSKIQRAELRPGHWHAKRKRRSAALAELDPGGSGRGRRRHAGVPILPGPAGAPPSAAHLPLSLPASIEYLPQHHCPV